MMPYRFFRGLCLSTLAAGVQILVGSSAWTARAAVQAGFAETDITPIGYIIPRRQWDRQKPFAYGRKRAQYGEANNCGPDPARLLVAGWVECVRELAESKAVEAEAAE